MTQFKVWTKEPGEEDFEIADEDKNFAEAAALKRGYELCGHIAQVTKTESENPKEYIKVDV